MKNIKTIVCVILMTWICGFALTSCGNNDDEVVNAKDIVLSTDELVFLAESTESQTVTFTANADWRATSEQGWIVIDTPVGKAGESSLSVSVKQNPNKTERQGNVIITEPSTGKMASFKVKQGAEGVNFVVDKREGHFVIDNENKVITEKFHVASNYDFDITVNDAEWVNYSMEENGDILFSIDTGKELPQNSQTVKIDFVSNNEDVPTESISILWDGYTPYIKFYSDEACTSEITELDFDESANTVTYVKSNVPWKFSTTGDELASLISYDHSENMTKGERLPYAIDSKAMLFVNFDEMSLSTTDQTMTLNFAYGSENVTLQAKKKGYNIYFDESQFRTLIDMNADNPTGIPTFPAVPVEGTASTIDLEFDVLAAYEVTPIILETTTFGNQVTRNATCSLSTSSKYNDKLTKYTYKLSVNKRTSSGEQLKFKLYIAKAVDGMPIGQLANEYLDLVAGGTVRPEKKNDITSGLVFYQEAYIELRSFESDYITKEGKVYAVPATGGDVTLYYTSDIGMAIAFFKDVKSADVYIEDGTMISDLTNPSNETDEMITAFIDMNTMNFPPLKVTVAANSGNQPRSITIWFAGNVGTDLYQYFGKFTINQAAATTGE